LATIITIFIYLSNIINALLKKHSKFLLLLMIALLWGLMGANTQNPDIYAYQISYADTRLGSLEVGYWALKRLFFSFGFEYAAFRMIISALGILLIHHTVKRLTDNCSAFYLFYFIYPFMMDVVQIRNFLAMAIFIFAVPYLMSDRKRDILKYLLLIIIAASVQTMAIFYLPLLVFIRMKKSVLFKILLIEGIIFLILISLNRSVLNSFSQILINTIGSYDDRIAIFAYRQTNLGFLLFWFMQFANFLLIYWANRYYEPAKNNQSSSKRIVRGMYNNPLEINNLQHKYIVLMFWINAYAFLFLPFYVFQSTFSRFMRNIIPLNLLAYIVVGQTLSSKSVKKYLFIITCFGYNLFLFYINIYKLYSENIVEAIFKYNWIFR